MGGGIGWLFCMIITLIILVVVRRKRRGGKQRFPPGPRGWPVLGHLHLFACLPHQALALVAKKYGPVLGLRLGQRRLVVVCSAEAAREVLLTHDKLLAHRPPFQFTSIVLFGGQNGVLFNTNVDQWRKHRKICMLHLFTAKRLHELRFVRQQELRTFLLSLRSHSGSASTVDIGKSVGLMSSRLLMRLIHSRASGQVGGENLQDLVKEEEHLVRPIIGDVIPYLSILDFFTKQRMRRMHARFDKVYTQLFVERKQSTLPHDDFLDFLLSEEEPLTLDEIKSLLHDIIVAGIHTVALTIEWAMAELLKNPRCLHRLQKEIDMQVGEGKEVSEEDLASLSYLKCVVKEVMRLHPVAPLMLPHVSIEECKVQGYIIPANTLVLVNVWAIGRDERVWPKANEFLPERFEGSDVDVKGQHFELLPFGSGRRICLGLPLALLIVETTIANLVSCFDWELPYGETHNSINMDEKMGVAASKATPVMAIPKPRTSF